MMVAASPRRFSFQIYRPSQPTRGWGTAAALVGAFTLLALAIRIFCRNGATSVAFWPADGALVVALIVLPKRIGVTALAVAFAINIVINIFCDFGLNLSITTAVANIFLSGLLAVLIRNFCGAATDLSRFRRLATFVGLAIAASGVEAAMGLAWASLSMGRKVSVSLWFWWTLGDALGLVIGTPAVLFLVKNKRYVKSSGAGLTERIFLFSLIISITIIAFLQSRSDLYIFVYPLILMMAFRAGPTWVLASVLSVSIVASSLTVHGNGPLFAIAPTNARLQQSVLQQFLISLFVCAVPVNNALGEMGRSAQRLRRIHTTARAAQNAAVAANLAKSQFIANVSHEIRTPLNGVLGMAQILAASDLSDLQRERVDVIHSSGEVLLSILNDVLDFSKIEAGKLDLEATPFDLVKIAGNVQAAFSAVAESKNLELGVRLEGASLGELYLGDPTRVRQIISNLVANALKFTPAGEVEIIVSQVDEGVVISVRDTGIGIPEDRLPKLFAQFEQVDASTTRRFGGTGLGLSICHELCRLMGGRILVDSQFGAGSTFTVRLPLKRVDALAGPSSQAPADDFDEADTANGDLRVLAAEDNKINQLVLSTFLQQMDVTPTLVENGALAIEAWRETEFDLILMDMQMPVMDGLTAVRAIRAAEALSGRSRSPIIALTADVMSHHLENYRLAGVDAVVAKPIQFAELARAMQSLLDPAINPEAPALIRA
jgi:signal transduction histidine kinase/ActR/RegA family two-component response regulator